MGGKNETEKTLEELKKTIDMEMAKLLPKSADKIQLEKIFGKTRYEYDVSAINSALNKPIWDFLDRGGKRWRPALFLMIAESIGGDAKKLQEFSIVPELAHSGCLPADSNVLKNPGEHVRIDSINKGDLVYTLTSKGRIQSSKVLAKKYNGFHDVFRVKTSHREVKATKNHPFLILQKSQPIRCKITPYGKTRLKKVMSRGETKAIGLLLNRSQHVIQNALSPNQPQLLEKIELETIFNRFGLKLIEADYIEKQTKYERPHMNLIWKQLEDIHPGDKIVVLRKLPDKGEPLPLPIPQKNPPKDITMTPRYTTKEFCQLFGYILGDGSVSMTKKSSNLYITPSKNQAERTAYKKLFKNVFGYELKSEFQNNYERLLCSSYKVCWLLREMGLGKTATTKIMPSWVFMLPESQKAAILRGYLDSDGTVAKNGTASFSSASEKLIRGVKLLADNMGMITGIVTFRTVKNLWPISKKKESVIWSVQMSNPNKILDKIGTERPDYAERMKNAPTGIKFIFEREFPKPPIDNTFLMLDNVKSIENVGKGHVYDITVENSHNFIAENVVVHNSVITDDVEDDGELRRDKPCIHKIFGVDIAINAGNFMYFVPLIKLLKSKDKFDEKTLLRAYEIYAQEMTNIHAGQAMDIWWHKGNASPTETQYMQMCAYKTGTLARAAARFAVALSGGSEKQENALGTFAESIGIAFQIQDDILDIVSSGKDRTRFGKAFGNDIKEGKRTLMVIHALGKASQADKGRILQILNSHTSDPNLTEEAISILKKYGSIDYARQKAKELVLDAWKQVDPILKDSNAKKRLKDFAYFLIERDF